MSGINIKIGTISTKFHYPYEGIFGKASPGPEYIVKEVTGNGYINLTNAVANHLMELKAYGGTEQNGTPTPDTPVDIICNNGVLKFSKNMANVNEQTALVGYYISAQGQVLESLYNRIYQEFIPCKPNTKYTISMSNAIYYISISEYSTAEDSGFVRRSAGSTGGNTQLTITTRSNTNYLRFGANLISADITIDDVLAINRQLEQGDTPTPYHEYVEGGIYIEGVTETIWSHTKNLFNKNASYALFNGYLNNVVAEQNTILNAYDGGDKTIIIKVNPSTTYTVTRATNLGNVYDRIRCAAFTELPVNKSTGVMLYNYMSTTKASATFTTLSDTEYVAINVRNSGTVGDDWTQYVDAFQLEKGETATEYQQYFDGGTATAEMLLKIGDYTDEQEILSGDITRKVGIKVLDGTETRGEKDGYGRVQLTVSDLPKGDTTRNLAAYCTHFENLHNSEPIGNVVPGQFYVGNPQSFYFHILESDVAGFKTWLASQYAAGTPVIVVYPLATPTTESVVGQTMHIPSGGSTIEITQASIDNLGLYAKYKATT